MKTLTFQRVSARCLRGQVAFICFLGLLIASCLRAEEAKYTESIPEVDVKIDLVFVPGGEFQRKTDPSKSNSVEQTIVLSPFYMAKYELTYAAIKPWLNERDLKKDAIANKKELPEKLLKGWKAVRKPEGLPYLGVCQSAPDVPCVSLSWWGAKRYCHWLSIVTGKFYRLPTEAEWEYACRAGSKTSYPWGDNPDDLSKYAWTWSDQENPKVTQKKCGGTIQPVGQKLPNKWGLYDMLGNAEEWVADGYGKSYPNNPRGRLVDPIVWPTEASLGPVSFVAEDIFKKQRGDKDWFTANGGPILRGGGFLRQTKAEDFKPQQRYPFRGAKPDLRDANVHDDPSYWSDPGELSNDFIGFRIMCPIITPSPTEQLWHWGIYKEYDPAVDIVVKTEAR